MPNLFGILRAFNKGLNKRMGDVVKSDRAVSHAVVKEIMHCVDQDWLECLEAEKLVFALEGTYFVLAFSLSLRGEEFAFN
jgi:hypothetical protein